MSAQSRTIAYLAGSRLRAKVGDQPPKTLDSQFANTQRERATRAAQRHSWKAQGESDNFLSGAVLWGKSVRDPGKFSEEGNPLFRYGPRAK
jgi:hypothetical protein